MICQSYSKLIAIKRWAEAVSKRVSRRSVARLVRPRLRSFLLSTTELIAPRQQA
jgi:hypothetical protein